MSESEHGKDCGGNKSGLLEKRGWDWDKAEKAFKRLAAWSKEEMSKTYDDSSLPSACAICKQPFLNPVETSCDHYFCRHCAKQQHLNHSKCFECGKPTIGVFKAAHHLHAKMEREVWSKPSKNNGKRMLDEDKDARGKARNSWKASKKQRVDGDEQDNHFISGSILVWD